MTDYLVLQPIDSSSAGRILRPGETYTADLDTETEKQMVEAGLIEKPTTAAQKKAVAKGKEKVDNGNS
jgi:hypothetical protein